MAPEVRLGSFDLSQQRGKAVLLFFGYTHCPDVCPTTLSDFIGAKNKLGARADSVRFVFISVDTKRDTPEIADRYAKGFDRSFIGLSGDSVTLAAIQRGFHVASYVEMDSMGMHGVAHSASVFVIDKDGRIRDELRYGFAHADEFAAAADSALGGRR